MRLRSSDCKMCGQNLYSLCINVYMQMRILLHKRRKEEISKNISIQTSRNVWFQFHPVSIATRKEDLVM